MSDINHILELEEYIEHLSYQYKLNEKEKSILFNMIDDDNITKQDLYNMVLYFDS